MIKEPIKNQRETKGKPRGKPKEKLIMKYEI